MNEWHRKGCKALGDGASSDQPFRTQQCSLKKLEHDNTCCINCPHCEASVEEARHFRKEAFPLNED